ncbi:MAG: hypothetical protein KDD83_00010 [Caldilineaceae bacterium]|nr:hypothetical protein [Caldilineaceae bacterium]
MKRIPRRGVPVLIWLVMMTLVACRGDDDATVPRLDPGRLTLEAPATLPAGAPLTVHVHADTPVSGPLLVTVDGSGGFVPMTVPMDAGAAVVELDHAQTQFAGTMTVRAQMGDVTGATQITVTPGPPVDPVQLLVGPRSIVADGAHWTMAVAVPVDARGNPVADDTPVAIHARHPVSNMVTTGASVTRDDATAPSAADIVATRTRHLLAWARVFSRTVAGDLLLAAGAGDAFSAERTVREVPGPPVHLRVAAGPNGLPADGRQLVTLETGPITDAFGNAMLDGMTVTFLLTDADGRVQRVPAVTVDGRARALVPAPARPGTVTVRALAADVESAPVALTFVAGPAVDDFQVEARVQPDEIALVAGPLVGALGQFVPDGTVVTFTVTGAETPPRTVTAPADGGYATAVLRTAGLEPGAYDVLVTAGTGQGHTEFRIR